MQAIVIGAGKMGYSLARLLAKEGYGVTMIERDAERGSVVQDNLDISVLTGNGASIAVLQGAGVDQTDLLIAVTEIDEVNMIACLLAKQVGVGKTVARVRNPEYLEEGESGRELISGIDLIINPELVTAREIAELVGAPEALDVAYYAKGHIQLLELRVNPGHPLIGRDIQDLIYEKPFLIVAIVRQEHVVIPRGTDRILEGDRIFLLAQTEFMPLVEEHLGFKREKAEKVMILGGELSTLYLAKVLEKQKHMSVTIIEKDHEDCVRLSEELDSSLVIMGDATDLDLLRKEGVAETDILVCMTDNDKVNMLACLIAKSLGVKHTISQVRQSDYITLMTTVGIDVGVSPRILTANAILKFIKGSANLLSMTLLSHGGAEMLEFHVAKKSPLVFKKLKDMNFPKGALIGSIMRGEQVLIAKGDEVLMPEDHITVFTVPERIDAVLKLFNGAV
ncbi:MAG: Trk system potassium transporter TrkA [Peptococcaceae bacterium]|jgi:trk system potassium uptake protein TrkA|nr:Trk system potassium transporter TrkA [Peptococcaceae bacterium]